ncbi:M23 family metallopeptidase [Gordonia sp. KTR9]|uniref:M23 family metallopeptidase n=1 Tax=Gordonia sp. KTR9 TaxID=337191 RepID=UPI00027DDF34|nr:M23 family metallopeptidase [Gordonia sp. KTR9]AFR48977.1 metalloendopeptidase-like membrane protein [Gordonia sp. KTR9]
MASTRLALAALGAGAILLASACGTDSSDPDASSGSAAASSSGAPSEPVVTPVVGSVMFAPTPFAGSDGNNHLVYEVSLTNYMRTPVTIAGVGVLDATADDEPLLVLDENGVRTRLKPTGAPSVPPAPGAPEEYSQVLAPGQNGVLFVHVVFSSEAPKQLVHEVSVRADTAPPGMREVDERIAPVTVSDSTVPVLGPPLAGERYIAADACCDAVRHTRAILPLNGSPVLAQRYAVDWEQADADGRIFVGDAKDPASYRIFGDDVLAVADGTVVASRNDLPEQTPGSFPADLAIADADGNNLVLDIGDGFYVNYAHMQPGSVRFAPGDRVRRGDVIGKVGNSGNSVAPHLHVHVMNGPEFLGSQGVPSVTEEFTITGRVADTAAFDVSEGTGVPLRLVPGVTESTHEDQMILDQNIVTFTAG